MSRLIDNSNEIRNNLEARNLYNPENPYNVETSALVRTVNTLANVVSPFSSFNLSNTVVGRLIGPNTPLAQIALIQLSKQFGYTVASNASAEYLPTIKFSNLFDGDPNTKLVMKKIDYQITRRESQSSIGRILEEISGRYDRQTPFTRTSTNADYIRNTGKGQLQLLSDNLNRNIYKPTNKGFISAFEGEGFKLLSGQEIIATKTYFNTQDQEFYPFQRYQLQYSDISNEAMRQIESSYRVSNSNGGDRSKYLEYGSTQSFVDDLGKTVIRNNSNGSSNYDLQDEDFGLNEDLNNQLIWGRDGVNSYYNNESRGFSNPYEGVDNNGQTYNPRFSLSDKSQNFNIKHGLLAYTKELLNSKGKYGSFDLTRKKFIDRDEQLHFNGSPLDTTNEGNKNLTRQHSTVDPYNTFVKAIRYNGNSIYGGNPNSTIYDSVIPKVHPILSKDGNSIDIRNMMFSLENLACVTIKDDENGVAYIDDDFGTELPITEAGPSGGRIMWFPPYDIQLSEQSVARHETTTFIGRGEPIYTYSNSERIANLSFKLLIDYPPQSKGQGHVWNSKFFAFGGDGVNETPTTNIGQLEAEKENLIKQRDSIQETITKADPQIEYPNPIGFYFPNDNPRPQTEAFAVQSILNSGYEINSNLPDGRNIQLNLGFESDIERIIEDYLSPEKRRFIKIQLIGSASELGPQKNSSEYNKRLSERRILAVKNYLNDKYKTIHGTKGLTDDGIKIETIVVGATGGTATDEAIEIPSDAAKLARRVEIRLVHNGAQETLTNPLTPQQIEDKRTLDEQISNIDQEIKRQKKAAATNKKYYFNQYTIEDGVLKGFSTMKDNKYKPVFHSQTPEDFHRRLTFLQQCTRQGNSIRNVQTNESGGISFTANNSVFGRQPVCVLRIGDFYHTKVVIENINFDYTDSPWDLNPEGFGMQFMIANITIQMKVIGGQSLRGPIDVLQNAVSFNYYANSTFDNTGVYKTATDVENAQYSGEISEESKAEISRRTSRIGELKNATPATNNKLPNN